MFKKGGFPIVDPFDAIMVLFRGVKIFHGTGPMGTCLEQGRYFHFK